MSNRSNPSFGIRFVEWLRDNGARGLVNEVEIGLLLAERAGQRRARAARAARNQPGARPRRSAQHVSSARLPPAPDRPVIHPALPGEGVWRATFATAARVRRC